MGEALRFLLIEDSPADELLLKKAVEATNLEVTWATVRDRAEFRRALDQTWDLIVTDYLLPDLRAEDVLGEWRLKTPCPPILVVSGRLGEDLAVEMMRQGAADFILKEQLARVPLAMERALREDKAKQARLRAEAQVLRLARMYRLLSETNQAMVRISDSKELLGAVCRLARIQGAYDAVIALQRVPSGWEVLGQAGDKKNHWDSVLDSALATGLATVDDSETIAIIPLKVEGRIWGCLGFHRPVDGTFHPEEMSLLRGLGEDLAFGLQSRARDLQRRESEQLLSDMANLIPGMFFKLTRLPEKGFRFDYVSPGIDLLVPISPTDLKNHPELLFRAVLPEDRRTLVHAARESLRNLTVLSLEYRLRRPNGGIVGVVSTAFPQAFPDGSVTWTGVSIDVTPQTRLQVALKRQQELLAVILENIADGVIAIDSQGMLTLVNRAARVLLDQEDSAQLRGPWSGLDPHLPWDSDTARYQWRRRNALGQDQHLEVQISRINGEGSHQGQVMLLHDTTDHDHIEERLHQSEKLESIGLLAGGIAHDFNNLLTGLFGYLQLARMNAGDSSRVAEYVDQAMGPFHRARTLTQQLLTFAKGAEVSTAPVDLYRLVTESAEIVLARKPIVLRFVGDDGPWLTDANESQVRQVFENLLMNAAQAMEGSPGVIEVTGRASSSGESDRVGLGAQELWIIEIMDSGPGIDEEALSKVFDPFFTTKSQGTGLGLSICFSVLKKHGGFLEVESPPGKGAIFRSYWVQSSSRSAGIGA